MVQDATQMVYLAIMTCYSGGLTPSVTVRRSPPSIHHYLLATNSTSWSDTDALLLSQAPPEPSLVAVCETVKVLNKSQRGDLTAFTKPLLPCSVGSRCPTALSRPWSVWLEALPVCTRCHVHQ